MLDFTQVVVLDYSCADEAVAKLIQRYQRTDRPADVYFVARGLAEQHRDPIEAVLVRHDLALVGEVAQGCFVLLGAVNGTQHAAWAALQDAGVASPRDLALAVARPEAELHLALEVLAERRVIVRDSPHSYYSLTALLAT